MSFARNITLLILVTIAMTGVTSAQNFQYNYLRLDYSILNQTHARGSWCFEEMASDHNFVEVTDFSISTMSDADINDRYYVSLNPIPSALGLLIGKRQKTVSNILLFPERIGNFKFQLSGGPEGAIYFGPNTDFYIVSKKLSVYSEIAVGLKRQIWKIKTSAEIDIPFSRGPLEDKDVFFSIGIGYVLKNQRGG